MNVFQYFSAALGANGRPYGFCFEHPASDIDVLGTELADNFCVTVNKLKTVDDGKGGRLITGRERIIIGAASVATIQNAISRHWEAADEAA